MLKARNGLKLHFLFLLFIYMNTHSNVDLENASYEATSFGKIIDNENVVSHDPNKFHIMSTSCDSIITNIDEIQIHIIVWRRAGSTKALLNQLSNASYQGWDKTINLFLHIDGDGADDVIDICKQFSWGHGKKNLDIRTKNYGLRNMWLSSLTDAAHKAGNNTVMLMLEDDIRVSSFFFQGLMEMIKNYANSSDCRNINLMGFSLSPIKVEELGVRIKPWNAYKALQKNKNSSVYLSNVPSSWAGAYFSDRWLEFSNFVEIRSKKPFFNPKFESKRNKALDLPGSRSNIWTESWKRFMVDFMFGRGLTMLYPSLPEEQGFATTLQLKGVHIANESKSPFVAKLVDNNFRLSGAGEFPAFHNLDIFDLHLRPSTQEKLVLEGSSFLRKAKNKCKESLCQNLFQSWARRELPIHNISNTPLNICVADLYMTSITSEFQMQQERNEKFLLLDFLFRKNANFDDIKNSLNFAKAIGRKLILPENPQVNRCCKKSIQEQDYEYVISVSDKTLKKITQTYAFTRKERILTISQVDNFDFLELILSDIFTEDQKFLLVNISNSFPENSVSIDRLKLLFGGCREDFLILEGISTKKILE